VFYRAPVRGVQSILNVICFLESIGAIKRARQEYQLTGD